MDLKASCLAACERHFHVVWSRIRDVPHRDGGILPSEMVAFICLVLEQGATAVVESGRKNGYSTETLAACTELGFELISVEREPILQVDQYLSRKYPVGVYLQRGNGRRLVPYHVRRRVRQADRVAALLDGPKGLKALKLFDKIGGRSTHGAVHDASRLRWSKGLVEPNPVRTALEARTCWFTDDPDYAKTAAPLDRDVERPEFANRPRPATVRTRWRYFPAGGGDPSSEPKPRSIPPGPVCACYARRNFREPSS